MPRSPPSLDNPCGVVTDSSGAIYIADQANNRIRRVDVDGVITTEVEPERPRRPATAAQATSATPSLPFNVAIDGAGTLFISERLGHRVRRVSSAGVITTVAGNGVTGFAGDGGPATSAELSSPAGLAIDRLGNLYIADDGNLRVRRVDASGTITTVAGTGVNTFGGDNGPATSAGLPAPTGVAVDGAGNLYIAESDHRVRRVDPAGIITTFAGTGVQGFSGDDGPAISAQLDTPTSVAVDSDGNVYIVDSDNNRIRRVDPTGVITTVAGSATLGYTGDGGPATSAQLSAPQGISVDAAHNLYIADTANSVIRRVDPTGMITTVAGSGAGSGFRGDGGAATSALLAMPPGCRGRRSRRVLRCRPGQRVCPPRRRGRHHHDRGWVDRSAEHGAGGAGGARGPAIARADAGVRAGRRR